MRKLFRLPTPALTAWIYDSRARRAAMNARLAEADGLSRLDRWDRGSHRPPTPDQLLPMGADRASRRPALVVTLSFGKIW
jgi:hypothetical protein